MKRLLIAFAALALLAGPAFPQTALQPDLKITVIINNPISAAHNEVTVRFLNQSNHNLSFPKPWTSCVGLPGSIVMEADAAPPTLNADSANLCGLEGRNWSDSPILDQAKMWWLLHPGQSVDLPVHILGEQVHLFGMALDNFQPGTALIDTIKNPGTYQFRVVYKSPSDTPEQSKDLLSGGYFLPSGDYESDVAALRVELQ